MVLRSIQPESTSRLDFGPQYLPRLPTNQMTMVASAFAATLEVSDLRYDLCCYGEFMKDIPRRLGTNDALDASVSALTLAFSSLHTRRVTTEMFVKYGQALKALRTCLCDPAKAQTAETLCAIYLTMICQVGTTPNTTLR